jgi:hypothetical protein
MHSTPYRQMDISVFSADNSRSECRFEKKKPACYRCDIIVTPFARLPEVANITIYEIVTQVFNSEDSDLLG